jgi:hypothetical protein
MSVRRIYDPAECGSSGVPLDWERCRRCGGSGTSTLALSKRNADVGPCPICAGHGSLKAAALAKKGENARCGIPVMTRCEDCGHPMSEGTWEGEYGDEIARTEVLDGDESLRRHLERNGTIHFSPCDEACRHRGPGRRPATDATWIAYDDLASPQPDGHGWRSGVQASWRPVDVRCLGWPHDLRPERLAVLCLRCWAGRRAGT